MKRKRTRDPMKRDLLTQKYRLQIVASRAKRIPRKQKHKAKGDTDE